MIHTQRAGAIVVEKVLVTEPHGLHLRAAVKLTLLKRMFKSRITLKNGVKAAEADSILGLMNLAASKGTPLEVVVEGADAGEAALEVRRFFENPKGWG